MKRALVFVALTAVLGIQVGANAKHAYNSRAHWARQNVKLVDQVTGRWDVALDKAIATWNAGLDNVNLVEEAGTDGGKCGYKRRGVRLCSGNYKGSWAGLAQFYYSSSTRHFIKGRIRLNDRTTPNGVEEAVTVHEIGHLLGLGHTKDQTSPMTPTVRAGDVLPNEHDYNSVDRRHRHLPHGSAAKASSADRASSDGVHSDDPRMSVKREGEYIVVTWTDPVPRRGR